MKMCTKCGEEFEQNQFYKDQTTRDGYSPWCKGCKSSWQKTRYLNPEVKRRRDDLVKEYNRTHPNAAKRNRLAGYMRFAYKISLEDYEAMVEKQHGLCAICFKAPTTHGRLVVDHDHKTGVIRGLLCHKCNVALGTWETEETLTAAVRYLAQKQAP
jgi:hypothetical protein